MNAHCHLRSEGCSRIHKIVSQVSHNSFISKTFSFICFRAVTLYKNYFHCFSLIVEKEITDSERDIMEDRLFNPKVIFGNNTPEHMRIMVPFLVQSCMYIAVCRLPRSFRFASLSRLAFARY